MRLRVHLVAILLIFGCASCVLKSCVGSVSRDQTARGFFFGRKSVRTGQTKVTSQSAVIVHGSSRGSNDDLGSSQAVANIAVADSRKSVVEARGLLRKRRDRRMDRTMLALVMAYKMKFIALIPTLMGGMILLTSTTLLAGFFFSLFAAVLGLKTH